ncbi:MAG TPA: hypothetical protein PK670_13755, partial [Acidovorax defluvii]|nr:hypothetical protein [Acidovorax defluvii]
HKCLLHKASYGGMKQGQGLSCADAIRRSFSNFSASHIPVGCGGTALLEKWRAKGAKQARQK